jgi:hypothetical protein
VLLGPFGGMLADRYDKRTVLMTGRPAALRADARAVVAPVEFVA